MHFAGGTGVGFGITTNGLLYNRKLVTEPPTGWNDIFEPRFKGKVMLFDYSWILNGFIAVAMANRPAGQSAPAIDLGIREIRQGRARWSVPRDVHLQRSGEGRARPAATRCWRRNN